MKKKIMIEGMSCEHCVAHVREALEELGATAIEVNLDGGFAVAEINCDDAEIAVAIDEAGYDFVGASSL